MPPGPPLPLQSPRPQTPTTLPNPPLISQGKNDIPSPKLPNSAPKTAHPAPINATPTPTTPKKQVLHGFPGTIAAGRYGIGRSAARKCRSFFSLCPARTHCSRASRDSPDPPRFGWDRDIPTTRNPLRIEIGILWQCFASPRIGSPLIREEPKNEGHLPWLAGDPLGVDVFVDCDPLGYGQPTRSGGKQAGRGRFRAPL